MNREEKLNKILEMSKEIVDLMGEVISDKEIDKMYLQTKIILNTFKELNNEE